MYRAVNAFLLGYKPTCSCQKGNPRLKPYFDRLIEGNYPKYKLNDLGTYLFFHTEKEKQKFAEEMKNIQLYSVDYVRKLGHTFGFPSKSVEFFTKHWETDEQPAGKLGVNCSGYVFATHIDILVEEVMLLWDKLRGTQAEGYPTVIEDEDREEYFIDLWRYSKIKRSLSSVTIGVSYK